jgi:hypothetical protein
MQVCDSCSRGWHTDCLQPPLTDIPTTDPWCCPTCIEQGITPPILDALLRQDIQIQHNDHPTLTDQRTVMEERAAALDGQLVQLNVIRAGIADLHITGKLHYLHPNQRQTARRPLLLEAEGFDPLHITVGKAERANRTRLTVNLTPSLNLATALHATQTFVRDPNPTPSTPSTNYFKDSYNLRSPDGFRALYRATLMAPPLAAPSRARPWSGYQTCNGSWQTRSQHWTSP